MKKLISCIDASFGYDSRAVVENLDFTIYQGDYVFIVGENGSGKSTLVKGILSLIKPLKGNIEFENGLKKNDIGYFPQQTEIKSDFPASVKEIVISGCVSNSKGRFFYSREDKKTAEEKMKLLDIYDIQAKSFASLSGGQKQRVLLARALCAAKSMLILDEPASNLDPVVTEEFYRIIDKINREAGITVLMVSHDVRGTVKFAQKVLHLGEEENFFGNLDAYLSSDVGKRFIGGKRI
ncbi:MAG: ATP-binding cassette domain-containing protein [Clostridia bacterium]|nr:ATP-binding cassette domain-containing protein [Clostridia bacterium]